MSNYDVSVQEIKHGHSEKYQSHRQCVCSCTAIVADTVEEPPTIDVHYGNCNRYCYMTHTAKQLCW